MDRKTPTVIELSVVDGLCTRNCIFCPVRQIQVQHTINLDLYKTILLDLSKWTEIREKHIKLDLTPFGEFFMHKDWRQILKMTYELLPDLAIYLHTNGDLIDFDNVINEVMPYINTLIIDIYDTHDSLLSSSHIAGYMNAFPFLNGVNKDYKIKFWHSKNDGCVNILNQDRTSNVYSGLIKHTQKNVVFLDNTDAYVNKNKIHTAHNWGIFSNTIFPFKDVSCVLPMRQLVIDSYGNVVLCCEDVTRRFIFGNIAGRETWRESQCELTNDDSYYEDVYLNSEALNAIRRTLLFGINDKKRLNINLCSTCTSRVGTRRVGIEKKGDDWMSDAEVTDCLANYKVKLRDKYMPRIHLNLNGIMQKERAIKELIGEKSK